MNCSLRGNKTTVQPYNTLKQVNKYPKPRNVSDNLNLSIMIKSSIDFYCNTCLMIKKLQFNYRCLSNEK